MTHALIETAHASEDARQNAGTPDRGEKPQPGGGKNRTTPIVLQVLAMIGIGVLVYSSAADWFATLNHNAEVSGYTNSVTQAEPKELTETLRIARDYNAHMPAGMLRDPYSGPQPDATDDSAYALYEQLLTVQGTQVIGELTYPRLGIGLPVYHGTSDEVLQKGVGHLFGSSLPVGGPSTHSVLTSHSGLVHASLFTKLPKAKIGDTFTMQVLGETHWYRVDSIETVLPEQTEGLAIVPGHDFVTLITCTPTGINSHRLLVRGERIEAPESAGRQVIAGDGKTAGFPWWALIFLAGSGVTAYLLFAPVRRRDDKNSAGNDVADKPADMKPDESGANA